MPEAHTTDKVTLTGIEELKAHEGEEIGTSRWHEVTQERVNAFAEATGDHYWIHTDTERAKDTPFGGTIAHGYYTLSLEPMFSYEMFSIEGVSFGVNYGVNKVRFPAPLPVGSKVRMHARLASVDDIPGGAQLAIELTFESDAGEKPVCVAESLTRVYAAGGD